MFCLPVILAINDETYCEHIEDTFERHLLLLHLLVDGQGCLGADLQLVGYAFIGKFLFKRLNELSHQLLTVSFSTFQLIGNGSVLLRIGVTEVDVFHLALDVIKTELVGEGNVQHHCLQHLSFS